MLNRSVAVSAVRVWLLGFILAGGVAFAEVCSSCGMSHTHALAPEDRDDFPFLTGHFDARAHLDQVYDAKDHGNEIYWFKGHVHGDFGLYLTPWLRLETSIKLEERHGHGACGKGKQGHHDDGHDDDDDDDHDDHDEHGHGHSFAGKDRYFKDHVAVIEQLKATVSLGDFEFFGGKFNPRTGLAMHAFPGTYGYEMVEEYSILERLGLGARYTLPTAAAGDVTLEVSSFFADTTFLNQGLGARREVAHSRGDGGLANTESFESFAAALSGTGWYTNIGDTFHAVNWILGAAYQNGGKRTEHGRCESETRYSVGVEYGAQLTQELNTRVIVEWMQADNFAGAKDIDTDFLTLGLGVGYRGWQVGGTFTDINRAGGEADGHHVQASAGYVWANGFGVHVGWKEDNHENDRNRSFGVTLSYHIDF